MHPIKLFLLMLTGRFSALGQYLQIWKDAEWVIFLNNSIDSLSSFISFIFWIFYPILTENVIHLHDLILKSKYLHTVILLPTWYCCYSGSCFLESCFVSGLDYEYLCIIYCIVFLFWSPWFKLCLFKFSKFIVRNLLPEYWNSFFY